MIGLLVTSFKIFGVNGNESDGKGANDEDLEESIGDNKGGEVSIELTLSTTKEAGGEETITDQAQTSGGEIGGGDDEGSRENTRTLTKEEFLRLFEKMINHIKASQLCQR